jgi:uncharacterized protein
MRSKDNHIAKKIREAVQSIDPKAEVILFGSRARGDAKNDSDWDVMILIDYSESIEVARAFRYKLFDLELETGEVFSTFVHNKKIWNTKHSVTPLYQNIKREGVLL